MVGSKSVMLSALMALVMAGASQPGDLDARIRDAESLSRRGDLHAAIERYKGVLPDAAPDDPRRGEWLIAVAMLENRSGDFPAAREHARQAAALYELRRDDSAYAAALNVAGLSELYAGDYRAALDWFQRAARVTGGIDDPPGHAEHLSNLGNVFFFLGRYEESEHAYAQALSIADQHQDAPWAPRRRRIVRLNQAALQQRLGRFDDALAIYRSESQDTALRSDEQAQARVNLGALYRRLGDPLKALDAYASAQALFEQAQHVDGELGALINQGIVQALDLDDVHTARKTFGRALTRATAIGSRREALHALLYRAEAAWRSADDAAADADFRASLAAARSLQLPEESWKALYGLGRVARRDGRTGDAVRLLSEAIDIIERLREELRVPSVRADFFQEKREVYDALIEAQLETLPAIAIFELIERSRARVWRERLGLPVAVDVASLQRHLDPGTVLLAFWHSAIGSAVVNVTRERATLTRLDVAASTIDALTRSLSQPGNDDWRAAAEKAARMLLPADIVAGSRRLVIVPDGELSAIPFEVLPLGGRPIVATTAVSYLPSASMLLRPQVNNGRDNLAPPWRPILTAFADPRYRSAGAADDAPAPLPWSAEEVKGVAGELGGRKQLHLGPDDLKARLVGPDSGRPPLLHVASHAVVENALERSRILFSSATAGGPPESLFLREVYDLDLADVQLVVLSACDTAQGQLLRGEGVQSFSRAFLAAGALSTVTTLWKVPDDAPVSFMRVFYHRLQQGDRRDDALRGAKLAMLESGDVRTHPFYWASFVLNGDAAPVSRALPWTRVAAFATVASSLLVLGGWFSRRRPQPRVTR